VVERLFLHLHHPVHGLPQLVSLKLSIWLLLVVVRVRLLAEVQVDSERGHHIL
jgi:hypothetical protein